MTRRNPKLSPRERLLSQVQDAPRTLLPTQLRLGSLLKYRGEVFLIHDANEEGLTLQSVADCEKYIIVPYDTLTN